MVMNPMSPGDVLPRRIKEQLDDASLAVKVSEESHNAMLDEMGSREALECDPSRVFAEDENSSGSEEEDEDEVENF